MAKDYGRKNTARQRGGVSKQLLVVLVCFLAGYLTASVFDFTSLSGWINTKILAQHPLPAGKQIAKINAPKPKFEFYTLLASEQATSQSNETTDSDEANTVAANTAPAQPKPLSPAKNVATIPTNTIPVEAAKPVPLEAIKPAKNNYFVQIAAFRSRQEAERMKAALALKGFVTNVSIVSQNRVNWYRVNLGPFPSRILAEKAQIAVARSEHIVGMIRKMDA